MSETIPLTIEKTEMFDTWLHKLKDPVGKVAVLSRIKRAETGNFVDHKLLPDTGGIYEMRIFTGNGYRIYYTQRDKTIYLLLVGGSKDSQKTDISNATQLWQDIKNQTEREFSDVK